MTRSKRAKRANYAPRPRTVLCRPSRLGSVRSMLMAGDVAALVTWLRW